MIGLDRGFKLNFERFSSFPYSYAFSDTVGDGKVDFFRVRAHGRFCVLFERFAARSKLRLFDPEVERKKDERDKTVTAEKLERVRAETVVIRDSILELMKKHFPKYELINSAISDPGNQGSGRRGQSTLEYEWKRGKSRLVLQIAFVFSPNEATSVSSKKAQWNCHG